MSDLWRDHEEHALTAETLEALFDNEIACIRVRDFASGAECRAFVVATDAVGLGHEYKVAPNVKFRPRYAGVPQFEYRKKSKADYFARVEEAYAEQAEIFSRCGFHPVERLAALLRQTVPGRAVRLAEEGGFGRYYAGVVRETTGGTNLHMDFARYTAPDYSIAVVDGQIATNFYAEGTPEGGETTVYNLRFVPPIVDGRYETSPIDPALVENVERHAFKPVAGHLVMFNSRCPHRVGFNPRDDGRRRIGVGCFIGRAPDGRLLLWS